MTARVGRPFTGKSPPLVGVGVGVARIVEAGVERAIDADTNFAAAIDSISSSSSSSSPSGIDSATIDDVLHLDRKSVV